MMVTDYLIDLPAFAGPLDLLLHLIERQELDITVISLYEVTGQFLAHVETLKEDRTDFLIDFLVVAARLVLIKSRALLPQTPLFPTGEEEEEDPGEALVRQLRDYKRFKQAAQWLSQREEVGLRTYLRMAAPPTLKETLDLSGITVDTLLAAVRAALERAEREVDSGTALIRPRHLTIEGQIERLRRRLKLENTAQFDQLLSKQASRLEVAVTLLAVLELIKRREIEAKQAVLFGPIVISALERREDASGNEEPVVPRPLQHNQ